MSRVSLHQLGWGGEGRERIFQQRRRFFQLWLLSTQGVYWKGEVKMCELSLRRHITFAEVKLARSYVHLQIDTHLFK